MATFRSTFQRRWMLFAVLFLSGVIAKAAVVYTTQASFTAVLSPGYYAENFERSIPPVPGDRYIDGDQGSATTLDLAGTGNVNPGGAFHFTISTPSGTPQVPNTLYVITPLGNYPGGQAVSTRLDANDLTLTFTSGNVTAVGAHFSLTDINENRFVGTFDVTLRNGTTVLFTDPPDDVDNIVNPTSGALLFRGFTTDAGNPITSLTFHPDSGFATLDDLYVGAVNPVPEPAVTGIVAGLFCLLIAGRGVLMRACAKLRSRVA